MNRFASGFLSSTPPVTKNLIIINVALALLSVLYLQVFQDDLSRWLGMFYFQSPLFKPWQIVTHMFMHASIIARGGIFHIFFNMYVLWMFGRTLEGVWGSKRFLIFYLVTGLGAAFFQQLVHFIQFAPDIAALKAAYSVDVINAPLLNQILQPGNSFRELAFNLIRPTVGASGAVYGLLLGFAMLFPNTPLYIMFIPIPIKAKWLVIGFGVMELVLGFTNSGGNIAHFAHLGGMIFGFFMIRYWNKHTKNFY